MQIDVQYNGLPEIVIRGLMYITIVSMISKYVDGCILQLFT